MHKNSSYSCARAFMRGCKGAFGAMLAHVPKDALDVGVVNQGLLHHLDALALGVLKHTPHTCVLQSQWLAFHEDRKDPRAWAREGRVRALTGCLAVSHR